MSRISVVCMFCGLNVVSGCLCTEDNHNDFFSIGQVSMDGRAHSHKRVHYNLRPVDSRTVSISGNNPAFDQTVIPYSLVAGSAAHLALDRPFTYHTWSTALRSTSTEQQTVDETILQLNRDVWELVRQKKQSAQRAREEYNPLNEMADTFLFWADQ